MVPFGKLVYLASPLTHADPTVRQERTRAVARAMGWFLNNNTDYYFFSPITHADAIAQQCKLPYVWEWWAKVDEAMISRSDELWILCIPSFKKSVGVNSEKVIAQRLGLPIKFVVPQGDVYVVTDVEPEDVAI